MFISNMPSQFTKLLLELLDIVVEKSLLHFMLTSSSHERDGDIIAALASVDFVWFQRIRKQKFKKRIRHRVRGGLVFYYHYQQS